MDSVRKPTTGRGAFLAATTAALLVGTAGADVIVNAERVPTAAEDISTAVSVVTAEELLRYQRPDLPAAVAALPGVHVTRAGGIGQTANIYLRGAKPEGLLVLVDGMQVNDPSLIGRSPDLSLLDVTGIDRIEVLRGPQSALYGADSLGGVINIITRRGGGDPRVTASVEAGSYETFREMIGLSGGNDTLDYAASVMRLDSEGFSAANEKDGNKEKDGVERTSLAARLGFHPVAGVSLDLNARYSNDSLEYDNGAGAGADSDENVADSERVFLGAATSVKLLDDAWQQRLCASLTKHNRDFTSDWGHNWFNGELSHVCWQHDLYPVDSTVLSIGAEYEREEAETDSLSSVDSETRSLFAQDRLLLGDRVVLVGGVRLDDHDAFGEEVTWRGGAAVKIKETGTRLRGTCGTGFKAPSLFQLYAPASEWGPMGNPDLDPETSLGWDVGLEQVLLDDALTLGLTYFDADYEDLIDFVAGYVNTADATVHGVEASADVQLCECMRLAVNYTFTESEDGQGKALSRRPKHRAAAQLDCALGSRVDASLEGVYVGERNDAYFDNSSFETVEEALPAYAVFNLALNYRATESATLFGRIENLFDEDYEELAGYGTAGFSVYGGASLSL